MNVLKNLSKQGRQVATASLLALALASCGGTPPPLPPPPPANGYYGGGGGGATSCGGMVGQPISQGPVTGTGANGASVTVTMGVNLSSLTGSVSFYLPDLQGATTYQATSPLSTVCLSTLNTSGQQSPGSYSAGYIQANVYGTVPVQTIYTQYGAVPVIGTSYGGAPTQYAQAQGSISGYIAGNSFIGTAYIAIPSLNYSNVVQTGGYGGYGGYGY